MNIPLVMPSHRRPPLKARCLLLSTRARMRTISAFALLLCGAAARATTYYVDGPGGNGPGGLDSNDGSSLNTAWATIGKANSMLHAGDTVNIRGGTYTAQPILPATSGTSAALPITYRSYPGETVLLSGGTQPQANISNRNWIVIDGLSFADAGSNWIKSYTSSHCTVENCNFANASIWGGIDVESNTTYLTVRNCSFDQPSSSGLTVAEHIYHVNSSYTLVDSCHFGYSRHYGVNIGNASHHVIVKNCVARNPWHANMAAVGDASDPTPLANIVYEDNRVYDAGIEESANPGDKSANNNNFEMQSRDCIIRRNIFDVSADPLDPNHARGMAIASFTFNVTGNRIYNNIISANPLGCYMNGGTSGYLLQDNVWKNNIFYQNTLRDVLGSTTVTSSLFRNNDFYGTVSSQYKGYTGTYAQMAVQFPTEWQNNLGSNPLFVDAVGRNFVLQAGSPMIDAGDYLTVTTGSGANSTLVGVADAKYFCDGFGIDAGDMVQIGANAPVQIIAVNYANNQITLATPITWSTGASVSLPYLGSKPDIGVYENVPANMPEVNEKFVSIGVEDGWVLESTAASEVGGSKDATGTGALALRVGDSVTNQQYKSILSFDTSAIPANAIILDASLELRRSASGNLSGLGELRADIRTGNFGNSNSLENGDFEVPATAAQVATLNIPTSNGGWAVGVLNQTGLDAINRSGGGRTQFRVYFATGDNGNNTENYLAFYSGENSDAASRPVLRVSYVLPPAVITSPSSQAATVGNEVTFLVTAFGSTPLSYEWRHQGVSITGNPTAQSGTLILSSVTTADAGTYDCVVSNSGGSATSMAANLTVAKAPATVTLAGLAATYDGTPQAVTATTSPAGLSVVLTYDGAATVPTNAGTYAIAATITDGNYAGSATGTLVVAKAAATIAFNNAMQTYDGTTKSVTITTTPVGLAAAVTYNGNPTVPTNAGSYAVVANISDANYFGSVAGTLIVAPAPATVSLAPLNQVYNGAPRMVTATTTPTNLNVALTYDGSATVPANAGSYAVGATVTSSNYAGSATGTLVVTKATASIALTNTTQIYDGSAKSVTVTTMPAGLAAGVTYNGNSNSPTNAGSYAVNAVVTDPNYSGSATDLLTIQKAPAAIILADLNPTYDGTPKSAMATTTPAGLAVNLTYDGSATAPTNAGSYAIVAMTTDPNYVGNVSGTLTIAKAQATVTLDGLGVTYDGTPHVCTATTAPAGLNVAITYDGAVTVPTNAGSYAVAAAITDANYAGSATGTLVIARASATIALANLTQAYDGTPKSVTTATTPTGLTTSITYDGNATAPVIPGTYAVVATITDPNYSGTASGNLVIAVTALVRHAPSLDGGLDGSLQILTGEDFAFNGNAWVSGDVLAPGTPTVRLSGHPTFAGTKDGTGSLSPSNYQLTLNGNAILRYLVRRTDPLALPVVSAPPAPAGTRDIEITKTGQSLGNVATLRNLTLNGSAGNYVVPAGTYGKFTADGWSGFILGEPGATNPVVYSLQALKLDGNAQLQIVGPVVLILAKGVSLDGSATVTGEPEWLTLAVASGGVTLNGNTAVQGSVVAPTSTVTINGNATLTGRVASDRLTINGNGTLRQVTP